MRLRKTAVTFAAFVALTGWLVSTGLAQTNTHPSRPAEPTEAKGFSDAGKAALSRQLSGAVSRGDTPGVVALVVGRDGVLYEGAAGKLDVAHNIAMPVNAIFSIASMTKPVTSVAIMMLFEEGKLKLDDPVSKYLTRLRQPAGHYEVQREGRNLRNAAGEAADDDPAFADAHLRHRLRVYEPDRVPAHAGDEKGRVGAAASERSWRQMELQRQHARARHDRRENHRRVARSLLPAAHLQTAGHGGYVVRRAARQTVARADAVQPRKRVLQEQPRNPSRRRRRPRSAAMAASTRPCRITASSCRCCSTAGIWGPRKS